MRVRSCKIKTIQFNKFYILHVVILGQMQYVLYLVQLQSCHFTPFIFLCQLVLLSISFIHLLSSLSDFLSVFQTPGP